jgi:hypothetical protein
VFCVHHLPASALEFLLCNAADKRMRTYGRTGDSADARSIASDGIKPIAIGQRFHATITIPRRNGLPMRLCWREGWISLWPPGLRRCVPLATTGQNHCAEVLVVDAPHATVQPRHLWARSGDLHRMVADWDCIVRNLVRVADGRVDPRVKPEDGHDGVKPRHDGGRASVSAAVGITAVPMQARYDAETRLKQVHTNCA